MSPVWKGFSLNARFSGLSGTRYSLVVNADINGDFVGQTGVRNDLAFVFDPNNPSTPDIVRTEMNRILNQSDNRAKDYIRESLGRIAERNGGENKALVGVVDVRLLKSIKTFGKQSLDVSVDVFNFANLLNKNWGGNFNLGNQSLLNVTGFNQQTQQYVYSVNSNVGVTQKLGTPYQIQLGTRYAF